MHLNADIDICIYFPTVHEFKDNHVQINSCQTNLEKILEVHERLLI